MTRSRMTQQSPADAEPEQVRAELADWVRRHWDPAMTLRDWRQLLLAAGWAVPSWPRRWHGRGLPTWADELVGSELLRLGAVGIPVGSGTWLAAPTILAHGSDDLRASDEKGRSTREPVVLQLTPMSVTAAAAAGPECHSRAVSWRMAV